jgi:hypothetical protein
MRVPSLLIVLLALVFCGCRHTQQVSPVAEYGQAGPGKIEIFIGGGVERPGRYYVDDGATLASISDLFGGFRACATCGFPPSRVIVYPDGHPEEKQRYSLSHTNDLSLVRLKSGDRVSYATIHF